MYSILLEPLENFWQKKKIRGQEIVPDLLIDTFPELTPETHFTNPL